MTLPGYVELRDVKLQLRYKSYKYAATLAFKAETSEANQRALAAMAADGQPARRGSGLGRRTSGASLEAPWVAVAIADDTPVVVGDGKSGETAPEVRLPDQYRVAFVNNNNPPRSPRGSAGGSGAGSGLIMISVELRVTKGLAVGPTAKLYELKIEVDTNTPVPRTYKLTFGEVGGVSFVVKALLPDDPALAASPGASTLLLPPGLPPAAAAAAPAAASASSEEAPPALPKQEGESSPPPPDADAATEAPASSPKEEAAAASAAVAETDAATASPKEEHAASASASPLPAGRPSAAADADAPSVADAAPASGYGTVESAAARASSPSLTPTTSAHPSPAAKPPAKSAPKSGLKEGASLLDPQRKQEKEGCCGGCCGCC
jgi:hypothetical protein